MGRVSLKTVVLIASVAVLVVVLVWVGFVLFSEEPDSRLLSDSRNDVFLSSDEGTVGVIDLVDARLDFVGDALEVEFSVVDPVVALGAGEFADFDVLLVLEQAEDVVFSYEVFVSVNSSGVFGVLFDVESEMEVTHELVVNGNVVLFDLDVGDLSEVVWVEWSVSSSYEQVSGEDLVLYGSDFMPNEGMHVTYLDDALVDE